MKNVDISPPPTSVGTIRNKPVRPDGSPIWATASAPLSSNSSVWPKPVESDKGDGERETPTQKSTERRPIVAHLHLFEGNKSHGSASLSAGLCQIGRDSNNEVVVADQRASRRHCAIDVSSKGSCLLRDLRSRNGTFVNGDVIQEHWLKDGDIIAVGKWRLVYQVAPPEALAADALYDSIELVHDEDAGHSVNLALPSAQAEPLADPTADDASAALRRNDMLAVLYDVGKEIGTLQSLSNLLQNLLDMVFKVIPADRGFVMLLDEDTGELVPKAVRSDLGDLSHRTTLSKTIAMKVVQENVAVLTQDATRDDRFRGGHSVITLGIRSAMCVPLCSPNQVYGIFYVDTRHQAGIYTADQLRLLTAIGRQAGIAIENVMLYEAQKQSFESLMETLAATIDARDPSTAGHSQRVAEYAVGIAKELGLSEQQQEVLRYAAFLHDYGKIGVRDAVLQKPGRLTDQEYQETKMHAAYTARILSKIRFAKDYREIPKIAASHHERIDGKGYPLGLEGDEIPLGARIIAVADVFDALLSVRYYKPALSVSAAFDELNASRGTQLDTDIVEAFKRYHTKVLRQQGSQTAEFAALADPGPRE